LARGTQPICLSCREDDVRPLAILLLEYSFTGELERAAALGLLITMIIGAMMVIGRKVGLRLSGSD